MIVEKTPINRRAILIREDGEVEEGVYDVNYPKINQTLGVQWIEAIYAGDHTFYLDEEGKMNGRERNWLAEAVYRGMGGQLQAGDYLVGPVMILGRPDHHGDDTDVDHKLIGAVHSTFNKLRQMLEDDQ